MTMTMKKLETIEIKGKAYVMVRDRIHAFRTEEDFKGWRIVTEIADLNDSRIIIKASVINPNGVIVSTGHAFEYSDNSQINKSSFVENCETSAIGRALGCLGIGIEESLSTAEEMSQAIEQQADTRKWLSQKLYDKCIERIQSASPNIMVKDEEETIEMSPVQFVDRIKSEYRMKYEYKIGLEREAEFVKI